jgi:hypothetical protein
MLQNRTDAPRIGQYTSAPVALGKYRQDRRQQKQCMSQGQFLPGAVRDDKAGVAADGRYIGPSG